MIASATILGALSIVGLSSYFLVHTKIIQLSEDAHYIKLANSQRMLSEKLLRLTEQESVNADMIDLTVDELLESHFALERAEHASHNTLSILKSLGPSLQTMTEIAGSSNLPEQSTSLAIASRKYHAGMIRTVTSLEQDNLKHLDSIISTLFWVLVTSVVLIAGALALSFGPIRNRLFVALTELEKSRDEIAERATELDGLRAELQRANEELSEQHETLRRAFDESTSANLYLTLASARFEELFHGVPFACFSVNQDGKVFEWNDAASELFDLPGHRIVQRSIYSEIFGPSNDDLIKGCISDAFDGKNITNTEIDIPFRESARQLLVSVFAVRAPGERVTAALIACANITKQKNAEFEAVRANKKVESVLESIQDAFVALDKNLVYRYVNSTAAELLDEDQETIEGRLLTDVAKSWQKSGLAGLIEESIESGDSRMFDHYFLDTERWYEFRLYPSEDGVSIFYNDITERKDAETLIREQREQLEQAMEKISTSSELLEKQQLELEEANTHLQELAITDGLTGLLNHRAMQDELTLAISRSERLEEDLSYALLDVDHFKRFNDQFGHQAGDEVLKRVAKVLSTSIRDIDVVARYGGEEFCVILPGADEAMAQIACERMREAIEKSNLYGHHVTASFGVATYTGSESKVSLVSRADQALYAAKASGRNKTCLWEPPSSANCA